jgi:hypothetical protein
VDPHQLAIFIFSAVIKRKTSSTGASSRLVTVLTYEETQSASKSSTSSCGCFNNQLNKSFSPPTPTLLRIGAALHCYRLQSVPHPIIRASHPMAIIVSGFHIVIHS